MKRYTKISFSLKGFLGVLRNLSRYHKEYDKIVVVKDDKESSSVVIMKKSDYVTKLDTMIDDGIMKGTYVETTDSTLKELSRFQDFLYRNFHNYERYKDMQPDSNQPVRLYGTAKTHKFKTLEDITVASLKYRPVIDQTGEFTYNAAKVISDYLKGRIQSIS